MPPPAANDLPVAIDQQAVPLLVSDNYSPAVVIKVGGDVGPVDFTVTGQPSGWTEKRTGDQSIELSGRIPAGATTTGITLSVQAKTATQTGQTTSALRVRYAVSEAEARADQADGFHWRYFVPSGKPLAYPESDASSAKVYLIVDGVNRDQDKIDFVHIDTRKLSRKYLLDEKRLWDNAPAGLRVDDTAFVRLDAADLWIFAEPTKVRLRLTKHGPGPQPSISFIRFELP